MPRRRQQQGLERVLGANALFATAYGNVGSSIYYALGLTASIALGLTPLVFIISGLIFPGTDNYAHLGGFLGGYGASALMNPLARERGDHLIGAIVCLAATLLALVFSVVTNLALLG